VNLFIPCTLTDEVIVRPYLSFFHSSHFGDSVMPDMTDVMLGASTTCHGFVIDTRYAYYNISPTVPSDVHELGVKVSADVIPLLYGAESAESFSLRPSVGLYSQVFGQSGIEGAYLETGLEPSWRFEVAGRKVGLGLSLVCGWSVDDYYFDDRGNSESLGYLSATLSTSISLPAPEGCGQWFLNGSLQYLHLFADNLAIINGGSRNEVIGKIGIGFIF
jgi:hypothetical protein